MADAPDAPRISAHSIPAPEASERLRAQTTASYEATPDEVNRVLLLYSGGLDTSVMLKWIQDEYDAEVVTLTVNLGQPGEDYAVVEGKARRLGAVDTFVVDAREEFATEFVAPAIKANATYGLGYPLFTALGRPLIAKLAVEYARRSGCDTIAHGCTGKGNDQVRIEATVATLAPELKLIAPVRSWAMGRDEEIAYAREHGIPVKGGTEVAPYSIDDNLWGRSSEGRWIEDLAHAPEDDVFQLVTRPEEAPDEAEVVTVGFDAGVPVALNGSRLGLVKLVGTIHQNQFKPALDQKWGYLVYAGLWWEPLRTDLDAYMDAVNKQVTGTIGLKLYKGSVRVVTRESPNAVYDASLASFAESGGLFSQTASPGFIELWSLQSRLAHQLRSRG